MRLFKWKKETKKLVFHNKRRNTINYVIAKLEESEKNAHMEFKENICENSICRSLESGKLIEDSTLNIEQIEIKQENGEYVDLKDLLCLKEYMVNTFNEGDSEYVNLLSGDFGQHLYLSSNNSEDYKFYSFDYNAEDNRDFSNVELVNENNVEFSKLIVKNAKFKNIIVDFPSKLKNISENISRSIISKKLDKHSISSSLSNISTPIAIDENNQVEDDVELNMLFERIKRLMTDKYDEYKKLLEEVSVWEENGYKNGIKFLKRRDSSNNDSNTTIRGIIDIDLNKENELFYESICKMKNLYLKNKYHLNDLITSKDLVNYIWETDPLTYDNTVDRSNRVYTWSDENPGYCIYYHSYKGALGVQGRDFVLIGYKDNSDNYNGSQSLSCEIPNLANLSTSSPNRMMNYPNSNLTSIKTIVNNISPSRLKKWSKKGKKSSPEINSSSHFYKDFNSNKRDSAFFISSDLSVELSDDKKFHSMIKNVNNPSLVMANCHLNGVRVEKLQSSDQSIILRMDILWIGDLNGKLPEFLKKTLLSSSLSTMKVLKDKFIEAKKRELFEMIINNRD
ncbi:hypothetical protein OJ253_879 [Cryptosporidium canis]|uniref:START domain-containing protein n=1 Tax=Cryptosporidium canis TaxID=195482 RepID=A0A9D5DLA0_9CRYT|nr:hypothetical protein OJ253_879 [Cryptosporidium canis]